jgi:hypothetical protein
MVAYPLLLVVFGFLAPREMGKPRSGQTKKQRFKTSALSRHDRWPRWAAWAVRPQQITPGY